MLALSLLAALTAGAADARLSRELTRPAVLPPRTARPLIAPGRPGELVVVPGRSRPSGPASALRFAVEVEGGLRVDRTAFAEHVAATLLDRRSWGVALRRVGSGRVHFRVTLASPATTDRLCAPLATNGVFSCAQGGRAVLSAERWRRGAAAYRGNRARYRVYMINHEVGHLLGRGHAACPGSGQPAPVMMQQTKGVAPCRPNPWPLVWERG
jgi:hypothetical protein